MSLNTYQLFLMQGHVLCIKKGGLFSLPSQNPCEILPITETEIKDYVNRAVIWSGKQSFTNKSYTVVYRYDLPFHYNNETLPKLPENYSWIPIEKFRDSSYGSSELRSQILDTHFNKIKRMLNNIEALN